MKTQTTTLKGFLGFVAALVLMCTYLSEGRGLADVPPKLVPPEGNVEIVRALGVGVQIYHSAPSATDPTKFIWKFFAPEATLFNGGGKALIHHFGGPSWQSNQDGSLVVGTLFDKVPSPDPGNIDWLLLTGASQGHGMLGEVSFIQRLDTVGGIAPATLPTGLGQEAKVPYTATYVFFAKEESVSLSAKHR